jgi:hypothetical protein
VTITTDINDWKIKSDNYMVKVSLPIVYGITASPSQFFNEQSNNNLVYYLFNLTHNCFTVHLERISYNLC